MALYPGAIKKLIPPGSNDPRITPRLVLLHVAVFVGPSLYPYFKYRSGGIESHFYIRFDGTVEQYRDTDYEADANYKANPRAISIETEGMADGVWTIQQLESIKKLLLWCHEVHDIPLRRPRLWNGSGVSYHSRFPQWSPVAKSCPGYKRIRQFKVTLVPWMKSPKEWLDMNKKEFATEFRRNLDEYLPEVVLKDASGDKRQLVTCIQHLMQEQDVMKVYIGQLLDEVRKLRAELNKTQA